MDTFLELAQVRYEESADKRERFYCLPLGRKIEVKNLIECFGGNAANTAIGLARLNLKTAIITSLDHGLRSQHLLAELKTQGVGTSGIKQNHATPINLAYILDWQKNKNDRVVLSYHQRKNFANISWPKSQWIFLTSLGEHFPTIIKQLPEKVNLAYTPGGVELAGGASSLKSFLKKITVLILNRDEAQMLVGLRPDKDEADYQFLIQNLLKLGPTVVVVTAGADGAYAASQKLPEMVHVPGLTVHAQEVTGAGDAFASGFLAGYLREKKLAVCLRWGILNASACIQQIGAQNGLLKLNELKRQYRKNYRKLKSEARISKSEKNPKY